MKILVAVDVQFDFMPGGALEVPFGNEVVEPIQDLAQQADIVIATQDWHPENHCSFEEQGGRWPRHCVQGDPYAGIPSGLEKLATYVVRKGMNPAQEEYSAAKALFPLLYGLSASRPVEIWVAGLALDYCVKETAIDLAGSVFGTVTVSTPASRWIDEYGGTKALVALKDAGVKIA